MPRPAACGTNMLPTEEAQWPSQSQESGSAERNRRRVESLCCLLVHVLHRARELECVFGNLVSGIHAAENLLEAVRRRRKRLYFRASELLCVELDKDPI